MKNHLNKIWRPLENLGICFWKPLSKPQGPLGIRKYKPGQPEQLEPLIKGGVSFCSKKVCSSHALTCSCPVWRRAGLRIARVRPFDEKSYPEWPSHFSWLAIQSDVVGFFQSVDILFFVFCSFILLPEPWRPPMTTVLHFDTILSLQNLKSDDSYTFWWPTSPKVTTVLHFDTILSLWNPKSDDLEP